MGIKLNLADVEVRDFSPLPIGKYHVTITDYEVRYAGEQAKNPGKAYLNVEFTVQEGQYEGRKCWTNVNFLPNALFTLKGIAQATDTEDEIEALEGEDENFEDLAVAVGAIIEGKELVVSVKKAKPRTDGGQQDPDATEVKGFASVDAGKATAGTASGGNSLLP